MIEVESGCSIAVLRAYYLYFLFLQVSEHLPSGGMLQ